MHQYVKVSVHIYFCTHIVIRTYIRQTVHSINIEMCTHVSHVKHFRSTSTSWSSWVISLRCYFKMKDHGRHSANIDFPAVSKTRGHSDSPGLLLAWTITSFTQRGIVQWHQAATGHEDTSSQDRGRCAVACTPWRWAKEGPAVSGSGLEVMGDPQSSRLSKN